MKLFSKKRLLLVGGAVTSVGAAAALLTGATFGFFSSAGVASGSNTFTAGHVVVGLGSGAQVTCAINPMSPGDTQASNGSSGQNAQCEYDIQYTGNVNAFLALDVAITGHGSVAATEIPYTQTTAPTAKQGLFDGTATGLQLDIHDGSATYVTGITYTSQANVATTMTPTGGAITVPNLLVNSAAISTGGTRHLVVNYSLPTTAGNAYNLATSSIVLRIHAVQADNNPLPTSPACVAGRQCDSPGMTWS